MSTSDWAIAPVELRGLSLTYCPACDCFFGYPRSTCPACGQPCQQREEVVAGRVVSLTTVHRAPPGFESWVPYGVALVACDPGVSVLARAIDAQIGDQVCVGVVDVDGHERVPVAVPAQRPPMSSR